MTSLYEHFVDCAREAPAKPALLACDREGNIVDEISRIDLLTRIEGAAAYLHSRGLAMGDTIALELGNSAQLLILSWAAWGLGIITVPLDMKRDTEELRAYKVKTSGAKLVITQEELSEISHALHKPNLPWMSDLSHEALILFTSGTTAYPKGARLTLQNLVTNAESIGEWLHITEEDRFLVELPLHHINSTTFCLVAMVSGASIAIPPLYSNSHFWEQVTNSGATVTSVVPSIIFDQLGRTSEFGAVQGRVRLSRIQLGSAPVVAGDALEFMEKFSIPLYQGYGQTETALRATGMPMNLPAAIYKKLVVENSIGVPMSWAQVEISSATGDILGEGEEGELVVKGPAVMKGYLGGEDAFRDGYFLTGDVGYWKIIEGKRFFFLLGRTKEIIIKGGVNISPIAVENALKKMCPDIEQVYVVGVESRRFGEEIGAAIVWKAGVEPQGAMRRLKLLLLTEHSAQSAYETPTYLSVVRADELPMTSTGKVQRTVLRKMIGDNFEPLYDFMRSSDFLFTVITAQSPLAAASRSLYNHCWQPLVQDESSYKKYLGDYITLGAIDAKGALVGQISFLYADRKLTCVSICSATFKPKPMPEIKETPTVETVRQYLIAGHDPVMNFHQKLGAELVEVTPGGRPEDRSSLGYTMLLRYPSAPTIELVGPVSNQLIQVVRMLAHNVGAEVYAVSRPGGLAAYLSRQG